jgi:serine protease
MRLQRTWWPVLFLATSAVAQPPAQPPAKQTYEEAQQALQKKAEEQRAKYAALSYEQFLAKVYKEPFDGGVYIVNGDTSIANEKLLREFYEQNIKAAPTRAPSDQVPEFTINVVGGLDGVWSAGEKRSLTYCVSNSFGPRYPKVVADMEAAAGAWAAVADVSFAHVAAEDARCDATNARVLFDVRPVQVNGAYLARSFFPGNARAQRNLLIDESALVLPAPPAKLQLVGVLRHELGHTIGARHEHTRPDSGKCFEDDSWRPVTTYDPFSVMHYPQCNGMGDWSLTLTARDQSGAACIYGPAHGFMIDSTICQPNGAPPGSRVKVVTFDNQTVTRNQQRQYDPIDVAPNTPFTAVMQGVGAMPGDPDLYLKFDDTPAPRLAYDCRPYAEGPDETCAVDVPANKHVARLMVHGYSAGNYKLTVTYTAP